MAVAVAVAVAVSGGGAVAVAGLTKRFFNHIQKDFLINVWVYVRTYVRTYVRSCQWPKITGKQKYPRVRSTPEISDLRSQT